jgi:hypothetical protein
MTQTGGLVVLLARLVFASALAVLGYWLLRAEKDPFDDLRQHDAGSGVDSLGR